MVLVVGGAGYVGSHVALALREAGIPYQILDNLERGHAAAALDADIIQQDLRDQAELAKTLNKVRPELVLHFAGYIEVGESVQDPAKFYQNNVTATQNLLDAMRDSGCAKLVFSSTAAVYGEPESVPIPEDHPKRPKNPYGDTKWAVERMLDAYGAAYGLRSFALRYFNASGADPLGRLGEDHRPETHLIPLCVDAVLERRPALKVFGRDYDTADGTCVRDYVHVCDLADAHLRAAQFLLDGGGSEACNLGSGTGYSVLEVMEAVAKVAGKDVPAEDAPRRTGDPAVLVASNARAKSVLGWEPTRSLEDSARDAYAWRLSHPSGYSA